MELYNKIKDHSNTEEEFNEYYYVIDESEFQ